MIDGCLRALDVIAKFNNNPWLFPSPSVGPYQTFRLWSVHRPEEVAPDRVLPGPVSSEAQRFYLKPDGLEASRGELEEEPAPAGVLYRGHARLHCAGGVQADGLRREVSGCDCCSCAISK